MHASNKSSRGLRIIRPGTATKSRSHQRLNEALRPLFEQLERRQLLSTTYYVNDNWVVSGVDQGAPGLDQGDTVENSGFGDNGTITGLTYYGPLFTSGTAFSTVADALAVATSGDTIRVISGSYSAQTTINQSGITLRGDNFGASANGARVTETVMNAGAGAFVLTNLATNTVIDGFTIRDASVGAGVGVSVGNTSGVQILNNIIMQNSVGVEFAANSSNFTVSQNKFDTNNRAGTNRGQGLRVLANTGIGTVTKNRFTGHGAFLGSTPGAITLLGSASVAVGSAGNGNDFDNNAVDMRVGAGTTGTTLVANTFASSSTAYIDYAATTELNASVNTFGGVNPSGNTNLAQQYAIVNKMVDGVDFSGRGLVRINPGHVYETVNSFHVGLGSTTPDIQRAVALATAGNIIDIEGGTYTGNVTTSSTNVTLSPGSSAAQVTISGSLTLDSNDTLLMEINGLTAGTQHDQLVVNGGVTLGSASLNTTGSTIVTTPGNSLTLIANDLVDSVAGTFAGIANGGNVTVNGQPFAVFYNGGTGNDVVLVRVTAAAPPAVVYVDDNWIGAINGTDQDGPGLGEAFGFDQFDNIQSAIAAVASGGTINVAAGTYVQNIIVDKAVSILGPNAALAGNSLSRVAEAVVRPENSDPNPLSLTASVVFYLTASNVTIKGLTVDGDNTSIVSAVNKNGTNIDAIEGISSYEGVGGITVQNNIVRNMSTTGVNFDNFFNGGAATSNNVISFNLIDNIGDGATAFATGINIAEDFYANVLNNDIRRTVIGIQTGNYDGLNPGATNSISNNTISAARIGLVLNSHITGASSMTVSGNTISAINDANFLHWDGIQIASIMNAVNLTISGNNINGSATANEATGYNAWNTTTSADLKVTGGVVTGVDFGVFVNNYDSFNANAGNTKLKVDGVDITADQVGVRVYDSPSNTNSATVNVVVTNGTKIQTGGLGQGVVVDGSDATVTVNSSNILNNAKGVSITGGVATISGNQIHNNTTGIEVLSGLTGSLISENLLSSNTSQDVWINTGVTGTSVKISGNSLEGTAAIRNDSAATIQASGNWWGTTTNPFSAGRIIGTGAALVDYSPWMFTSVDLDSNPVNGFQPINDVLAVDDNSPQSTYLSAAATRIAEGISILEDGGQLFINGGTYVENVNTASPLKSVAISLGASPAQVTITGSLTLDADDVLLIEAVGTNPATDYDNLVVSGTATLGNASLITTIGYVPAPSDVLTIIDATTLTGTFVGLPQGADVGGNFRIDYNAGLANVRFIQNTPFVVAEANGPYGINEGQSVTLSSAGSFDPDAFLGDVIVSYSWDLNNDNVFGDVTGATPTVSWATLQSFGINDGNANYPIKLRVTNNLGETGTDTSTITVTNVAPTIAVTGAVSSNEGSTYSLTLGPVVDPGADTVSSYRINWGDGSPADTYTPLQILGFGGVVKHVYVDDNPTATPSDSKTITVDLQDEDNTPSYYTGVTSKTITVNNVNPSPTITGAPAQSLVNVPITVTGVPNDPGTADTFTYAWSVVKSGFGTYATQTGASNTFSFTPNAEATYTISLTVTDDDTGVGIASNVLVTVFQSYRVVGLTPNNSGFSLQMNRPANLGVLNLYDGDDAPVQAADMTVIGALNPGTPIRGSLIWDATSNTATWVATGGVLAPDTYTITLVSGSTSWTAASGPNPDLDGNGDGTGGDNYVNAFVVAPAATRVVSVQDFTRGPSQNVLLPLDNSPGASLPVRIDNAQNVTSVDFSIIYNPLDLNITAVAKEAGVPADWSIFSNVGAPTVLSATQWQINVTLFTTINTVLSASAVAAGLVKVTANVPSGAIYGSSQVVKIQNVVVGISNVTGAGRGDYAVHKVAYIGDVDGDTIYTGSDAGLIAGVIVGPHNGFDIYDLTDPRIVADVDNNGTINGNDASFVAQKSVSAPRPEIPNRPAGSPPVATGLDPTIDIPDNINATPGATIIVPVNITDSAAGLKGFNVDVTYNNAIFNLANGLGSLDVTLGSLFDTYGGWNIVSNVDQAGGVVHLSFYRPDAMSGGTGTVADLHMHVSLSAPAGVTAVNPTGFAGQGGFAFTYLNGSVLVGAPDTTGPAAPVSSFNYNNGFPQNITFTWAENVSGPKTLILTNLTTNTVVPVTLVYNPNTATYTFPSFPNGILPNGNYQGVISAASVTDQFNNPMAANAVINFFVLAGDANRDRIVNVYDLIPVSVNQQQAGTFSQGDFNYDGIVNATDLGILGANWQQSVPPPLAPPLASPVPASPTSAAPAPAARPAARTATRTPTRVIDLVE